MNRQTPEMILSYSQMPCGTESLEDIPDCRDPTSHRATSPGTTCPSMPLNTEHPSPTAKRPCTGPAGSHLSIPQNRPPPPGMPPHPLRPQQLSTFCPRGHLSDRHHHHSCTRPGSPHPTWASPRPPSQTQPQRANVGPAPSGYSALVCTPQSRPIRGSLRACRDGHLQGPGTWGEGPQHGPNSPVAPKPQASSPLSSTAP